ncbi:hypothetical protein OV203_11845 [Nannocystis sp. ILAH1]|uniref:hypothetical protein n=1 Tax=Nannocystis sp. ILAH1 TaxID=2996789 RepID=UPI00226F864D|nr:hypothetical protein [Nannocystis sp. ILAH1]MCY0987820.1 hypothetical protein [Nannocystis sp. ILAH1]
MRLTPTALLLSVALAIVAEAEARACSCGREIVGAGRLYLGAGGVLPPDAPGFPWTGPEPLAGAADRVKVTRIAGTRRVPVKFTITGDGGPEFITPAQKFAPGQVYEVTIRESARAGEARQYYTDKSSLPPAEVTTRVTIGAAPLRLTQASLRAGPQTHEDAKVAAAGSCWEDFAAAKVPIRVELPPEVEPLRDYLLYVTRFDGHTWRRSSSLCSWLDPGRTWTGEAGTDMVFAVCGPRDADAVRRTERYGPRSDFPEPGRHSVEMIVVTPDGSQSIKTPAITIDLSCAPPPAQPTAPLEAPAASGPLAPLEQPEPPTGEPRGCAIGEPGFAWLLGAAWWLRRRSARRARSAGCSAPP